MSVSPRKRGYVHLLRSCLIGFAVLCVGQLLTVDIALATGGTSQAAAPQNVDAVPRIAAGVNPTLSYFHYDATGNVAATTDSTGKVTWRAEMQPFGLGESTSAQGAQDRPLRFSGQPLEEIGGMSSGLYQLGARFYDPVAGRFFGVDPLAVTDVPREEPQRLNRFAYGLNNPYRYADTTGASPEDARKFLLELAKKLPETFADPSLPESLTPVRELTEKLARLPGSKNALVVEGAAVAKLTEEGFMHWLRSAWAQGAIKTLQNAPRSTTGIKLPGIIGIGITLILSAPSIAEAAETSSEGRYGSTLAVGYEYLRGSVALANPLEYEIWTSKLSYSLTESLYGVLGLEASLPPRQKTAWEQSQEGVQQMFHDLDQWLAQE